MKKYTRVFAEIDLDAICFNMESMKRNLPQMTEMIGVVKADGYGHGSVPIAGAISPYVKGYAVATAQEALLLRRHGIEKPVLILGPVHESYYEELILHRIRPCVFTMKQAEALSRKAVSLGQTADFHLVVDTGMSRIGMEADEAGADLAVRICSLPGIRAEGLFTHFARADETDKIYAERQLGRYLYFVKLLGERGIEIPIRHCANSAGIIDLIGTGLDWVRAGISIYGLYPSDQVNKSRAELRPAMALKSFVTYVNDI